MSEETKLTNEPAVQPPQALAKPTLFATIRMAFTSWWKADAASIEGKSPNELSEIRTDLALSRNMMAADRTLMAWIRTALSMNSFGFTIYKLLETYQKSGADLPQGHTPRTIGLFLTGRGGPAKSESRLSEALQQWAIESPRSREHETTPP